MVKVNKYALSLALQKLWYVCLKVRGRRMVKEAALAKVFLLVNSKYLNQFMT